MSHANKILFQLSGSIACYKACQVISRLVQAGHDVQVVATKAALRFVGEATLEGLTGKKVLSEVFEAGSYMDHINLGKWADLLILCPASANTINKLGNGIGDDLISTLFLAHDFNKPYLLAPAMNTRMYQHPSTQSSLKKLESWGVKILETASGVLACGDHGEGKLLEPDLILNEVNLALQTQRARNPLNILITAGGTREAIDGVRAITNFSTGRTGSAIADYFSSRGHEVTLLRAKDAAPASRANVRTKVFESFADLDRELTQVLAQGEFDAVLHAAAVSDYSVASITLNGKSVASDSHSKIASGGNVSLNLKSNTKLLPTLKSRASKPLVVVGFKLTNHASIEERNIAVSKVALGTDLIVQNDLSEIGDDQHKATLYKGSSEYKRCSTKLELAKTLEEFILKSVSSKFQEVRA